MMLGSTSARNKPGIAWSFMVLLIALVPCVLLSSVPAASAAEAHPFVFSFASLSNPNGIAIDEASGDVYVANIGTDTVNKFDALGNPVSFSSLGTNALGGAATPAGSFAFPAERGNLAAIAIDNSTSPADPSAGDLYVMDAGNHVIDKFDQNGTYIGQIVSSALLGAELLGMGVEPDGQLRVYVAVFGDKAGIDVFDNSVENAYVTHLRYRRVSEAVHLAGHGFAMSPTGDMFILESCGCVEKRGDNMEPLGRVDPGPSSIAAAVDPATGHLYVDDGSSITEWDTGAMNGQVGSESEDVSSGATIATFGAAQLAGASEEGGIAVNGATGDVYVANPAKGTVDVFGTSLPVAAAGAATDVAKTAATLHGTVEPRGATVTACQFEYGAVNGSNIRVPVSKFERQVPCDQTAAQIAAAPGSEPVTAEISGLAPGQLYDFRLVAESSNGTNVSSGRFAAAGPGFGIKEFEVSFFNQDGTSDTQAGSHPYSMVTSIALNTAAISREKGTDSRYAILPDQNVRDIITDLPPGLVGDPNATPVRCTLAQLEPKFGENSGGGHCPPESVVGELEVRFGEDIPWAPIKEPVYNMVPPPGVAAQIGGDFIVPAVFVDVGVHGGGDYPLEGSSVSISGVEPLTAVRLTIFGLAGKVHYGEHESIYGESDSRKPFLTLPTGCTGPLKASVRADSYDDPGRFVEASTVTHDVSGHPLALAGCSKLEFPPTITVAPDTTNASSASGLTVGVHVPQTAAFNPDGLAESSLRDTTVTLPEGVTLNPAGADGLEACSEGLAGFMGFSEFNPEFEPGVKTATFTPEMPNPLLAGSNFCPSGSKIATVKIATPLLPNPLEGAVYLAAQGANPFGSLVAMYLVAEDPVSGTVIKLPGEVSLTPTGQIVTTFKNTPDLPFEDLELHFFGGERAPLSMPSRCGTYTTQASFTPWDGNGPVNSSSSFQITAGPNGGPCPGASLPFAPSLTAGGTNVQAGAFTPFTMTMSRADGSQNLDAITLHMPPGLSGTLNGVELCGEPQADEGTCGPNSLIGETTISVGVGGHPFTVTGGKVYMTGPYKGAPFGLSIVNPAKAGPIDVGQGACDCVVVRAKLEIDPSTAALTVTSDTVGPYQIPTMLDGIPLQIQHINVTINRPDFTFNPTNCEKTAITGGLTSSEGASDTLSVPFQVTNCARLFFKPQFRASTSAHTSRADGASFSVKLTYPSGGFGSQANIKQVKVELPKQLPSRLQTLQKACLAATFETNPAGCPPASIVGHAKAITPLVPVPLEGPAYFVSHGGEAWPSLVVVLQGYGVTIDLVGTTFVTKTGITSSTFKTVPDAPVGSFELTLPTGPYSALTAVGNVCAEKLTMPTEFLAQNGAQLHQTTKIAVTGCPKHKQKTTKHTKHKTKHKHAKHKQHKKG